MHDLNILSKEFKIDRMDMSNREQMCQYTFCGVLLKFETSSCWLSGKQTDYIHPGSLYHAKSLYNVPNLLTDQSHKWGLVRADERTDGRRPAFALNMPT